MSASSRWLILVLLSMSICAAESARAADLSTVERTIGKQPAYIAKPGYCLLLFGPEAKTRVWMVEDGKNLYVDRNANGDLTDDGPPLQPTELRTFGAVSGGPSHWDFDYVLDEIKPASGPAMTNFRLRRWNYGEKQDSFGLSVTLNGGKPGEARPVHPDGKVTGKPSAVDVEAGEIPMYAGWFGSLWADSPEKASIVHFGGPLEPRFLRGTEFVIDSEAHRLSVCFITPGIGDAGPARLGEEAIPIASTPIYARIEWPVSAGSPTLVTMHKLGEHCCYWEYYDSGFRVPQGKGIAEGTAIVTFEVPGGKFPLPMRTNRIEVPVRMPGKTGPDSK